MNMIRVLLAEDQAMVRGALAALLSREQDIEVIAEVARGDMVVEAACAARPDVALLDIEMPDGDGLAAAQALHVALPSCRVVILTTFGRSGYLRRAMDSGAVGFLLKDEPASELASALRRVMNGERVVDPELALLALSEGNNPLTPREREVLRYRTSWDQSCRDRRTPFGVRRDRAQPPLRSDAEIGNAQPDGGRALGGTKGLVMITLLSFLRFGIGVRLPTSALV